MRIHGRVVRIRHDKGFGFVRDTISGNEHFFHRSECNGLRFEHLTADDGGTELTYDTDDGHPKGPRAVNVLLAEV